MLQRVFGKFIVSDVRMFRECRSELDIYIVRYEFLLLLYNYKNKCVCRTILNICH